MEKIPRRKFTPVGTTHNVGGGMTQVRLLCQCAPIFQIPFNELV